MACYIDLVSFLVTHKLHMSACIISLHEHLIVVLVDDDDGSASKA